ncbi:hypothetical protein [Crateriforma spongiae]|uniref:hypothetical protein n=1 Tax=Crateriforma spongiae TaxID=2724528 RepID=UPI001F26040B|nr:hypothetical protein [Crateriforma spongiae]
MQRSLGWDREIATSPGVRDNLRNYITLHLAAAGLQPPEQNTVEDSLGEFSAQMLESLRQKNRLLTSYRAPVDARIEGFLNRYFGDLIGDCPVELPNQSLTLDRHGMARELSLPVDGDKFENDLIKSYRCENGILNNPRHDRRTTAGTFHIVEGGLPIPGDKRSVPRETALRLFRAAMTPPQDSMLLPYTSQSKQPGHTWVSLLLRPLVCPEVPGVCVAKSIEMRFYAPASLVSNLDFVESIFGNAGDPMVPENDAGLDVEHWSGHTGCAILAPHLSELTKKELGLPHYDDATERQRRDSMCWKDENEKYNDGSAFKLACRDEAGVMVTLIADNYYGYCKKEVKTQISFAANLMGNVEEEHAGGALAFASYSLGEEFQVNSRRYNGRTFADLVREYPSFIEPQPSGYGIDRQHPGVIYIPENAFVTLKERCIRWEHDGKEVRIKLSPDNEYITPSGYRIRLEKHPNAPSWRLVGTIGEGIACHKPCTVSGGGKSEISKSLRDYMLYGPIFIADRDKDFAKLDEIFNRSYADRWRDDTDDKPDYKDRPSRSVLDPSRSLGSMIQLLTPQPNYSDEYIQWLNTIPDHVYAAALIIKRFMRDEMRGNWRDFFSVDIVNGSPGHELKLGSRSLVGTYLRVGLDDSRWRTFKLRQDFIAAAKVQREDDISASVVVPATSIANLGKAIQEAGSYKFVENCEYRLFQRPDDAIHRGLDKQTEIDLSRPGSFISNFQPLGPDESNEIVDDVIEFQNFTKPMKDMLSRAASREHGFVVSTDRPRLVNGKPTKNPRYLQDRPDAVRVRDTYVAFRSVQLHRALKEDQPVYIPVGAVLAGRRNNPPDEKAGIRSLAVYSPLHYQELPELLMDWVCSLTGKSPSTTGAGSEGALTKGPFNALPPSIDLNAAVVSMILTGLGGFSTAAGHIGPRFEFGHDVSLLIPEIWCRMSAEERDPAAMIKNGMLEPLKDFEVDGKSVPASRLGYRITRKFVHTYLARVFDSPDKVFTDDILKPELQDAESFADGILHIAEAQQRVAKRYFEDGSYELACPPLQAILSILANGDYEGKTVDHPDVRALFDRDHLLASDWYRRRLVAKQTRDIDHWKGFENRLQAYLAEPSNLRSGIADVAKQRLQVVEDRLKEARSEAYLDSLVGTLGADPLQPSLSDPSMVRKLAGV